MTILINRRASIARSYRGSLRLAVFAAAAALFAQPTQAASRSADPLAEVPRQHVAKAEKGSMKMSENQTSSGSAEMAAAKTLTTRVLAIGTWTAKATPKTIPSIMPSEAYDTAPDAGWKDRPVVRQDRWVRRGFSDERDRSRRGARAAGKAPPRPGRHDAVPTHPGRPPLAAGSAGTREIELANHRAVVGRIKSNGYYWFSCSCHRS
jgi:hypothetical protein